MGKGKGLFMKNKQLTKEIRAISDQYGLDVDPTKVYNMSVETDPGNHKSTLPGAKILYWTNLPVLTPQEIRLFKIGMRDGCAVVIITLTG